MKIILSPAKSLNLAQDVPHNQYSNFFFSKEAIAIDTKLKKISKNKLITLMDISDSLAQLNWQRNQDRDLQNLTLENAKQAIYTFDGDVYDGFDVHSLPIEKLDYLQNHVYILSGLYGILKPLDLIQSYRLEMGKNLAIGKNKNLYEFWKTKITSLLNLEINKDEVLINLASNEYFSVVDKKKIQAPIVTPEFKEYKNGNLKTISFFAKKARGQMARFIIENNKVSVEDLKKYNLDKYSFDANLSSSSNLIFTR